MTTAVNTSISETPDSATTAGKLVGLRVRLAETQAPADQVGIDYIHDKGKTIARECIEFPLDEGPFVEVDASAHHCSENSGLDAKHPVTGGVTAGYGTIDGRQVCVFSQDGAIFGGALGETYDEKIVRITDLAFKAGVPVTSINEGAGARIQEGVVSPGFYSRIFFRNTQASGVIPRISLVMGVCTGGHVYSPAPTDFTVMVDGISKIFIIGSDVIKTITGEEVVQEELDGAGTHMSASGTSHYTAADDGDALTFVQELVSYLPFNSRAEAPRIEAEPLEDAVIDSIIESDLEPDALIPDSPNQPYDIKNIITRLINGENFLEIQENHVQNMVTGFGCVEGRLAGLVANQPTQFADYLDIKAFEKAARFIRTYDAFNIPIIALVDVSGFLPDTSQEFDGIIRRDAKLLYAYARATVPKITVVTRKVYGRAYCVMSSKDIGVDINLVWPTAQIAIMGISGVVGFIHRKELKATAAEGKGVVVLQKEYEAEYEAILVNPYMAAERDFIDATISLNETRGQVIEGLRLLDRKVVSVPTKKHGNIPL